MRNVIIKQGGLQGDEGSTYYSLWGQGHGENLKQVCEDIIRRNPNKAKDFQAFDEHTCSDWGFKLFLEPISLLPEPTT